MLETLDLYIPNVSEFLQCLKSSFNLRTLYRTEGTWSFTEARTQDLLEHITLNSGVRMCPRLRKIVFGGCMLLSLEDEVVSMIHTWWNRSEMEEGLGSSLEAVEFSNCSGGEAIALQLEKRYKGLDIVINNDSEPESNCDYSDDDVDVDYYSTGDYDYGDPDFTEYEYNYQGSDDHW